MKPFVLYCKSYRTDVKRVARLAKSVALHNVDQIPFYVSAPNADLPLFKEFLIGLNVELISDESILEHNPDIDSTKLASIPGSLSQQVVKSEFWRTNISTTYICLDSDCIFIRPFRENDFITANGTPYTVIDEGRDLFFAVVAKNKSQIIKNFSIEAESVQNEFEREGKNYNFGPNCPIWDSRVWASLEKNFAKPKGLSFLDLILKSGNEQRWYGEALLKYKAIDLLPSQPYFKMYHYAWQQKFERRIGITDTKLAQLYCGVVYQSAWEREMDWPSEGGSLLSRTGRRIRRSLNRI